VPKNAFNLVAYYEKAGFSARAAYSWRDVSVNSSGVGSSFSFQDITGTQKTYTVYAAAYGQLDAQVGYDFGPHVGILLSAVNLANSKQHTYLRRYRSSPVLRLQGQAVRAGLPRVPTAVGGKLALGMAGWPEDPRHAAMPAAVLLIP